MEAHNRWGLLGRWGQGMKDAPGGRMANNIGLGSESHMTLGR